MAWHASAAETLTGLKTIPAFRPLLLHRVWRRHAPKCPNRPLDNADDGCKETSAEDAGPRHE
jgi:hypothetical protein